MKASFYIPKASIRPVVDDDRNSDVNLLVELPCLVQREVDAAVRPVVEVLAAAELVLRTPLGIVVFVNYGSEWSKNVVETNNRGGHGLVMSYKEEGKYFPKWEVPDEPYSEDNGYTGYIGNTHESAWNDFSGYDKTQALEYAGLKAASLVSDWKPEAPIESSGWFIPTTAQWGAALCSPGLGGASWPNANDNWTEPFSGTPLFTINTYTNTSGSKINLAGTYWTSSAQGASANKGVFVKQEWKTGWAFFRSASNIEPYDYVYLRPFFAF